MRIPIRNLYHLFLYAWGRFPGGAMGDVGIDNSPDLPNLFAKLLTAETHRLFRRGLERGYRTATAEVAGPRGRLRLDRIVREVSQLRGTAICDFDELTHDILHHQILKATLANLACCVDLGKETQHDLRLLARRFHDVSDVRISASDFRRMSVTGNNRDYHFLMRLCEFVFLSLMPDERGAVARFQHVVEDEVRMSAVFEDFLRNFFRLHRTDYRVRAEAPQWYVSEATADDLALLPRMITDITLRHRDHTIIVDAKFYKKALGKSPYGERVRSQNLYQLITYLQHERMRHKDKDLSGVLIYPKVDQPLRLRYRLLGIPVLVATVDLVQEWHDVEAELQNLLDESANFARSPIAQPAQVPISFMM